MLCQDDRGYRNLSRLITRAYIDGRVRGEPLLRQEWFTRESCAGLIALSGGLHGDVGHALVVGHPEEARQRLAAWQSVFDDRYYLELMRTGRSEEEVCVETSLALASEMSVPVVPGIRTSLYPLKTADPSSCAEKTVSAPAGAAPIQIRAANAIA